MIKKIRNITSPVSDLTRLWIFMRTFSVKKTGEWGNYTIFNVGGVKRALKPKGRSIIFLLVDGVDEARVLIGALAATGRMPIEIESLKEAIRELVPAKYLKMKAFELGYEYVQKKFKLAAS